MRGAFLAVDWGTTNRRVYLIGGDGSVEQTERDDRGVLTIEPGAFAAEAGAIRSRFGDLPMLCAGMIGSNRGWANVPYVDCPAGFDRLAAGVHWVEPGRTAIVPGLALRTDARADVMRGEEVQFLGAAAAGIVPLDALLCQPGTHCKWGRLAGGALVDFTTAMTGELFALLRRHSLLSEQLDGPIDDDGAFGEGVEAARSRDLLAHLFGARAAMLLGSRSREASASYVSGLLIGSDVAAHGGGEGAEVHILADPVLGALYGRAIAMTGGRPTVVDSHSAFVAGILRIWELMT